jgi:two-component system, NarL family, response regulator LiaR
VTQTALRPGPSTPTPSAPAAPVGPALRVAVFSQHQLTRSGLTHLLAHDSSRALLVEGPTGAGHLGRCDVVVFDLLGDPARHLGPVPDDLAVLLGERVPVIALTSYATSHLAETALAMGVADIVHPDVDAEGLLVTLERAGAGQTTTLAAYRGRHRDVRRAGINLTDRERVILELVATGLPNLDIAERLYLSINTVKTYIRTAYRKIGVTRRAEAVLWAVHHGLVPRPLRVPLQPVGFGVDLEANGVDRDPALQPGLGDAVAAVHQLPV